MPGILDGVAGLFHGSQRDGVDEMLGGFAAHLLEQALNIFRMQVFRRTDMQAERADKVVQLRDLVFIRRLVRPVHRRNIHPCQMRRDRLVGGEHKFLDQPVRKVALRFDDIFHVSLKIKHEFRLWQVEIEAAPRHPLLQEQFRQFFHQFERRQQRGVAFAQRLVAIFQHLANGGVRQPRLAPNHARRQVVLREFHRRIEFHKRRHGEPVFAFPQGTEVVRNPLREHRNGAVGEIDARAALIRFLIQRAPFVDVIIHVRDMHAEPIIAVVEAFERDRVVEIPRVFAVNRENAVVAQIEPFGEFFVGNFVGKGVCLMQRRWRKFSRKMVRVNDNLLVNSRCHGFAENLDDFAVGIAVAFVMPENLRHDDLMRLRAQRVFRVNIDLKRQFYVFRDDIAVIAVRLVCADNASLTALHDLHDFAFRRFSRRGAAFDFHDNRIAMPGVPQIVRADVHIRLARLKRQDEGEALAISLHAPDNQPNRLRQREAVLLEFHQFARRKEFM